MGAVALLLLAGGCGGYYNGMYNAKRIAGQASKAEREGRTLEANSLWGQLAVKAESVAIQHPAKPWSAEARLLQGTALVKLRNCDQGLPPLEDAMVSSHDREVAERAMVLVGECRLEQGDPQAAQNVFNQLLTSRDPGRRSLARYEYGRVLRLQGRNQEAVVELVESRHPAARGERAAALATLGRLPEALALADSLLARPDTLTPWTSLLAAIAPAAPESASAIVDRLTDDPELPSHLKTRLLLEDGLRWLALDTLRSARRLAEAENSGRGSPLQAEVRYRHAEALVHNARTSEGLEQALAPLEELEGAAGSFGTMSARLSSTTQHVIALLDSMAPGTPLGDLRLFLAGELARDSLAAPDLAAGVFRRLATGWPDSPFAPKALLASIELQPQTADSLRAVLLARYPGSPYVTLAQGGDTPEYAVLEDSLRLFFIGSRSRAHGAPVPPRQPGPPPPPPVKPRQPTDLQ